MQENEYNDEIQVAQQEGQQEAPEAGTPEVDWKAEALKHKAIADRLKKKFEKPQALPTTEEKSQPSAFDTDSLIDNIALVKEYDAQELATIRKEAKDLGVDMFKYMQSQTGKVFIEKMRSDKQADITTLAPSTRGVTFRGRDVKEIFADSNASKEEKQAAYEALVRGGRGSNL